MVGDDLGENRAKISRESEIAALVELLLLESGPAPVHLAALDMTTDHKQRAGVTVIGTAVSILSRHAAELGHRENHDIVHPVAEVGDEGGDRFREIVEPLSQLACR